MQDKNREEARVSTTAAVQTASTPRASSGTANASAARIAQDTRASAFEREQLADRLHSLRRVLPVLAHEMAAARRQAAHLRIDNRRLSEQVRELRAQLEAREPRRTR